MATQRIIQHSFAGGEVDPKMLGRYDVAALGAGALSLLNCSQLVQGAVRDRGGFRYLATAQDGRLVPFRFNDDQRYIFLFYDTAVKIYDDAGTLLQTTTGQDWVTADLFELKFTQSADTLIIFHPDFEPVRVLRTGASTFSFGALPFENDSEARPYFKHADDTITLSLSAATGSITATTSSACITADHDGSTIKFNDGTDDHYITGIAYASPTTFTGTLATTASGTGPFIDWWEWAWSTPRGWPRCGVFHDERLLIGGTRDLPSTLFGSKTAAYFNFDVGTGLANEGINHSIGGDQVAEIRHLVSGRNLQIFTDDSEYFVPETSTKPFAPENIRFQKQTPYGSSHVEPQLFDNGTIFTQNRVDVCREYLYDDIRSSYTSTAINLVSQHLVNSPRQTAVIYGHDGGPEQYYLVLNTDGTLAVFHGIRAEKIQSWLPWETAGTIRSICGMEDDLYLLVQRTINAGTVYYIEKLDRSLTLDAAKTVTLGGPGTVFTGFTHLANETVHVVSGTLYLGEFAVNGSGEITIDTERTTITAGLNYDVEVIPVPPELNFGTGTMLGEPKRLPAITLLLDSTVSIAVNGRPLNLRKVTDDLSLDPSPFTGSKVFRSLGWSRDPTITITRPAPLSMTLLGIIMEVQL